MENVVIKKPRKKIFQNRAISERIVFIIAFIVFAVVAALYVYVLVWTGLAGLKAKKEFLNSSFLLPKAWRFANYIDIFTEMSVETSRGAVGYFEMLFNSLYFSLLGPLIQMSVTSLFAYTCTKYRFPFSKVFYAIVMIMMTLPLFGTTGSMYKVLKSLGLISSYLHLVLALAGMNTYFLYFSATYEAVSDSYGEAAIIDGANDFQVYYKVMFPQAKNLFLSLFIMAWVASWNDYSGILLYLPDLPTLAGGIYMVEKGMSKGGDFHLLYAAYFVSAIPPLIIFALFNNVLTNSVSVGGIKE